jgi:hypothetical protein
MKNVVPCVLHLPVIANAVPSSLILVTLLRRKRSSETSGLTWATLRHNPENEALHLSWLYISLKSLDIVCKLKIVSCSKFGRLQIVTAVWIYYLLTESDLVWSGRSLYLRRKALSLYVLPLTLMQIFPPTHVQTHSTLPDVVSEQAKCQYMSPAGLMYTVKSSNLSS